MSVKKLTKKLNNELGIEGTIDISTRKGSRFMYTPCIFSLKKYGFKEKVHFGDPNAVTFFDKKDFKKRRLYIARHSKILLKDGRAAYTVIGTPAFFSYYLLWN